MNMLLLNYIYKVVATGNNTSNQTDHKAVNLWFTT